MYSLTGISICLGSSPSGVNQLEELVQKIDQEISPIRKNQKLQWNERVEHNEGNWESIRHDLFEYSTMCAALPETMVCSSSVITYTRTVM